MDSTKRPSGKKYFTDLPREEHEALSRQGGKTILEERGRDYMRELARKGGRATASKGRSYMAAIGRSGGLKASRLAKGLKSIAGPVALPYAVLGFLLSMTYSSCGILPSPDENPKVEPEFAILYSQFLADATRHSRELELSNLQLFMGKETDFKNNEQGHCTGPKTIRINPAYWNKLQPGSFGNAQRELLIYHELGHCVLGQSHPTLGGRRTPNTIMNPMLMTMAYIADRETYIKELFDFDRPKKGDVAPAECVRPFP